ncbi:MAG: hypothetical protein ACI82S_001561, partial [Patiriisocius sp.]
AEAVNDVSNKARVHKVDMVFIVFSFCIKHSLTLTFGIYIVN